MSSNSIEIFWFELLSSVALQCGLLTVIAVLVDHCLTKAHARKILWQICTCSMIAIVVLEFAGGPREMLRTLGQAVAASPRSLPTPNGPSPRQAAADEAASTDLPAVTPEFRLRVREQGARFDRATGASPQPDERVLVPVSRGAAPGAADQRPDRLADRAKSRVLANPEEPFQLRSVALALLWVGGLCLAMVRLVGSRILIQLLRWNRRDLGASETAQTVAVLARQLGFRRRIRLFESPRLGSPVAFGIFRPQIGLPSGFTSEFSSAQQKAMLAHELAHLASHDPAWHLMADLTQAVLWWHPAAWWCRRELRQASETAADEASLLITDGPGILAECLVLMGSRLTHRAGSGWIGMAGPNFRSGLGQRVARLVELRDRVWTRTPPLRTFVAKSAGLAGLTGAALAGAAFLNPHAPAKGETMKSLKQTWTQSATMLAFSSALALAEPPSTQAQTPRPAPADSVTPAGLGPVPTRDVGRAGGEPVPTPNRVSDPKLHAEMMRRYGLGNAGEGSGVGGGNETTASTQAPVSEGRKRIQAKLDSYLLDEVAKFDGIPLNEVLSYLSEESKSLDPDRHGINFLITNNPTPAAQGNRFDPNTGQPSAFLTDVGSVPVRFNLPLRHVRLKDVLDAISRVADQPIRYAVEDYGVVFFPDSANWSAPNPVATTSPPSLVVRTFRVDQNTFLPGLEAAFGISPTAPDSATGAGGLKASEPKPDEVGNANPKPRGEPAQKAAAPTGLLEVQRALRRLFMDLGVNMDVANKAVFYNEITGIVMVRSAPEDLELIQAAMETLGGVPNVSGFSAGYPMPAYPGFGGGVRAVRPQATQK